jgi:uncharacterized protein (TIGR02246 family)
VVPNPSEENDMAIRNPEEIHRAFATAANAGAVEDLVALYEPGAVVVERNGEVTVGTEAIRSHIRHLMALKPAMRIETSRAFCSGDLALLCSRWTATATSPDGKPVSMDFRGSEVVRRQSDGSWRLVLDNPWGIELI